MQKKPKNKKQNPNICYGTHGLLHVFPEFFTMSQSDGLIPESCQECNGNQ